MRALQQTLFFIAGFLAGAQMGILRRYLNILQNILLAGVQFVCWNF
jgi:hypothetical protein